MANRVNELVVKELTDWFRGESHCIVVGCQKISAAESLDLRSVLRQKKVRLTVVKNSLASRAFEEGGFKGLGRTMGGPCAVVTGGEDMPSACKAVAEWNKKHRKLELRGGFAEGRVLDSKEVERMASLPSKRVLLARFVGGVMGVSQRVACAFQSVAASLGRALEEVRKQKDASVGGGIADGSAAEEAGGSVG